MEASEKYLAMEGRSPIASPREGVFVASANEHLKNRATYRGQDVIDLVEQIGVHALEVEEVAELLDTVSDMTDMQKVKEPPAPVAGVHSHSGGRAYVVSTPHMKSGGAFLPSIHNGTADHVQRQFKARLQAQN